MVVPKRIFPLIVLLAAAWILAAPIQAEEHRKTVLVLHSYHKADWTDGLMAGITSVLDTVPSLDLVVEYMDTKRITSEPYYRALDEIYRLKYSGIGFDAILTSDDNAYRFALARQAGFFKAAPIVFCGVNRFDPQEIAGHRRVTGVVEKGDFKDTLAFAVKVRPRAAAVHVILDNTHTGQINKDEFLAVMKRDHPQMMVRFLMGISLMDLAERLATLPQEDFAFFISFWQEGDGSPVSPESLSKAFYGSAVPVFGRSEWMINKGLTGGKCVSGFYQGEAAARLVERILQGEDAAAIPVNLDSPNRFMFDYRLLKRFGIPLSALPAGNILFNEPDPGFYERYSVLIWSVASILAVLTVLVVSLALNMGIRRRTEKALRVSETRYRTLVEHAADAIFLSDAKGQLVDVNRRACEILGYHREELLTMHVSDVDASFESMADINALWAGLQPGAPVAIESVHRRKDGSVFHVDLRIGLLEIDNERFILGLAHDITARKQMEAELRESESRYRQLVQYAPAGIYQFDMQRRCFLSVNDVMCEYTGYSEQEFLALDPVSLLTEDSIPTLTRMLENLDPDDPTPPPQEYRIRGKDGRVFWVLVNTRFTFKDNRPIEATAVVHDLTALRQAEEEKKRLEAKLVQVQKMESLGTLAGGIAHDFNNLLMGIQGNASLMLLDDDRQREDVERLRHIESQVQRGVSLTRQLLGLARGGKYEVTPTDLNVLVHGAATMFSRTKKEIRLHHQQQADIWAVSCDRGQLDQVLLNIFVNAWQAMPGGGDLFVRTENTVLHADMVQAHSLAPGRYVKISVTDTGTGMPPDIVAKIFDPFFTTKERERGTGLGLASAYGIIKNHEGFIDVSSRFGEGSTFDIYLPAVDEQVVGEAAAENILVRGTGRILLVDDEAMVLDIGRQMLERLGYTVLTAGSGAAALDAVRSDPSGFDLVVLDMIMPAMSGEDTFLNLQVMNPDIRVLLSSGYSIDGHASSILEKGCRGFIQKPFNLSELSQKVRTVLDGGSSALREPEPPSGQDPRFSRAFQNS
ncbi:MAG: PAS domain S-box protein [Pseudomonadota bacterium]